MGSEVVVDGGATETAVLLPNGGKPFVVAVPPNGELLVVVGTLDKLPENGELVVAPKAVVNLLPPPPPPNGIAEGGGCCGAAESAFGFMNPNEGGESVFCMAKAGGCATGLLMVDFVICSANGDANDGVVLPKSEKACDPMANDEITF